MIAKVQGFLRPDGSKLRPNELDFAQEAGDAFLYSVFEFRVEPKLYTLRGEISNQSVPQAPVNN
jgi:hypothetical protein